MVERFKRVYVDAQSDWERYLPLVLYAYRTSVHASTGISPFVLMLGRHPRSIGISTFVLMFGRHPRSTSYLIMPTSGLNTQKCMILSKQTWQKQHTIRNLYMTSTHHLVHFPLGILFGFLSPQQGSLALGGRENGLLNW